MPRARALAVVLILGCARVCLAHDPGLSSVEVRVARAQIVADLSLAAADAAGAAAGSFDGALDVRIDGRLLPAAIERLESGGVTGVRVRFTWPRDGGQRLALVSHVPHRLASGHRQLISIRMSDGRLLAERMVGASGGEIAADLTAAAEPGAAGSFFCLGVEHIAGGFDHLLFVAALLFGVKRASDAVKSVTAFTAAHSTTLAASTLGWVQLPASVVEPLIAASIMYVAAENIVRRRDGRRCMLTFAFGLVHGFGFAGALRELGVRSDGIVLPLAAFNLGVEAGQVSIVAVLMPIVAKLQTYPALAVRTVSVGSVLVFAAGGYWLFERLP